MLKLSELTKTKFYQEAFAEGEQKVHLKAVGNMIRLGLSLETIAQALDLTLEDVQRFVKENQNLN